jgi:methylated-DNA-[protein]-cysteine S-methyltransferase
MSIYVYERYESPLKDLYLVGSDAGLAAIVFTHEDIEWRERLPKRLRDAELVQGNEHPQNQAAREWLDRYFAGEPMRFEDFHGEIDAGGTDFQRQVWSQLAAIPYGQTTSYGRLAEKLDNPKAMRAVGLANGQNPISILVPCHRVVGSTGKLTGFGGGIWRKERLLALECGGELFPR